MAVYSFRIHKDTLADARLLKEASADELRVLLVLIARDGEVSAEDISASCGCSLARVKSAIALFLEEGVITPSGEARITEEFKESLVADDTHEQSMLEVARTLRDSQLQDAIDDFQNRIGKGSLRPFETSKVTALSSEFGFSAEFIMLYIAHLDSLGKLSSASGLYSGAKGLFEKGIRTVDDLNEYIKNIESTSSNESEIKTALGIYRQLSPTERVYIKKWTEDFLFFVPIISLAYDITVMNTGKVSFKYMDTLLSDWHSAGCKTEPECKARHEQRGKELAKSATATSKRESKPKLKYGDFDPEEALKNAIRNSGFFDDDDIDD